MAMDETPVSGSNGTNEDGEDSGAAPEENDTKKGPNSPTGVVARVIGIGLGFLAQSLRFFLLVAILNGFIVAL